ncbi:MAG: hypothetical protein JO061_01195, partial [Acidobacteriaceae bacterium]|nr:hypothetical protein [Acidobacteriaceae bacterium]
MLRSGLLPFACCVLVLGAPQPALAPNIARALASIDANDLKANLSFLASDALQGRYTPSPGLDIAAEFIASRFRAIGLEPGGNDGYFQTAQMVERREKPPLGDMAVCKDGKTITIHAHDYVVSNSSRAETIKSAAIVAFAKPDIDGLRRTNVKGKAVLVRRP